MKHVKLNDGVHGVDSGDFILCCADGDTIHRVCVCVSCLRDKRVEIVKDDITCILCLAMLR